MCEEVRQPAIQVPRAIVGGVALNMFAGLVYLLPVAFVLPDIPLLAAIPSGQPVPTIMKHATGNSAGAFCLLIPLLVLGIICGIGCVTATSRCTWAFARDGAIPGSGWWKQVHEGLGIPLNAMLLGMVVELLLGLIYFGSSAAFSAFSGVGVIFLTLSYACPVAVSLILRRRRALEQGSFNLGLLGCFCNVVCIGEIHFHAPFFWFAGPNLLLAWCLLAIPLFSMPTSPVVTKDSMNYASVVFVGFVLVSAVWYFAWGRANYVGPSLEGVESRPGTPQSSDVTKHRSSVSSGGDS